MWYISFILVLYVIYPFYFRHFKNYGLKVPILFILGGFVVMCIYAYVAVFLFDNKKNWGQLFFLCKNPYLFYWFCIRLLGQVEMLHCIKQEENVNLSFLSFHFDHNNSLFNVVRHTIISYMFFIFLAF